MHRLLLAIMASWLGEGGQDEASRAAQLFIQLVI